MLIIGITSGCAIIGGIIGMAVGFNEGGDFNFAPVIYGPVGVCVGGFIGLVGSVIFTGR